MKKKIDRKFDNAEHVVKRFTKLVVAALTAFGTIAGTAYFIYNQVTGHEHFDHAPDGYADEYYSDDDLWDYEVLENGDTAIWYDDIPLDTIVVSSPQQSKGY